MICSEQYISDGDLGVNYPKHFVQSYDISVQ